MSRGSTVARGLRKQLCGESSTYQRGNTTNGKTCRNLKDCMCDLPDRSRHLLLCTRVTITRYQSFSVCPYRKVIANLGLCVLRSLHRLFMKQINNMRLLPQSKKLIAQMKKAGYPLCLGRNDWSGKHARHCNACIRSFKLSPTPQ